MDHIDLYHNLNIDYSLFSLFTSIVARQLERFLPNLIHDDQTGFILEHQTQDNIHYKLLPPPQK